MGAEAHHLSVTTIFAVVSIFVLVVTWSPNCEPARGVTANKGIDRLSNRKFYIYSSTRSRALELAPRCKFSPRKTLNSQEKVALFRKRTHAW
jgi:hypothetical protein